jgi:hypothetical protein
MTVRAQLMTELLLAATEIRCDWAALSAHARELRIARQRERAALDGIGIRLLRLTTEMTALPTPTAIPPDPRDHDVA